MSGTESRRRTGALRVLVVDDEPDIRELLDMTLARMGLQADCVGSLGEARRCLGEKTYQLCLTDMRLPDGEGIELVREIASMNVDLPVAVITAHASTESAVSALKAGAFDYIAKPVSLDQLRGLVRSAVDVPQSFEERAQSAGAEMVGESPAMQHVRALIDRVSRSQAPIYITGESGTGKELAARRIHQLSGRAAAPFVPVNCGAIPEALVESEFFGYRKGAFTGATEDRDGFFHAARGGTLFLDEVADLPLGMQVKLLRAIQEKRVRKVGATVEEPVDVRLICATHQDLRALVDRGRFRQDLYYRINVIELRMPALRDCQDDIERMAQRILGRLTSGRDAGRLLSPSAVRALLQYPFPGNVRELENVLERALALMHGECIEAEDLGLAAAASEPAAADLTPGGHETLQDYLDAVERKAIAQALEQANGNRTAAAKLLGISFRSIRYRMARLGMNE